MATFTHNTNGNGESNGVTPHIILYTNHGCPFAHRAHITLKELDLPYEEVIIDLDTPRDPEYLEINPRGLVPSIKYSNGVLKDEIITESAIVAQFLADSRPSPFLPASLSSPTAPLFRARLNFFVDTWNTKIQSSFYPLLKSSDSEKEELSSNLLKAIEKEIDPLLADAAPFFGGSETFTLAEAITAPFVLRFYALSDDGVLFPKSFKAGASKLPNFGKWADKVVARESVTYIWNEENIVGRMKARIAKMKEAERK